VKRIQIAATLLMLIDELRFELPGESNQIASLEVKVKDEIGEAEYVQRTDGMPAEAAAAVALEISDTRKQEEDELLMKSGK
jgi:hypothetical protein